MRYLKKGKWILKYVAGKSVLDLGSVGQDNSKYTGNEWLHGDISKTAKELVGVDIDKEGVDALKKKGFDVVFSNVEEMNLNRKFEVIVAGDIIEHVSNAGLFLSRVEQHLEDDGVLVLCTPNPITVMQFFSLLFFGSLAVNDEHTCWLTKEVLSEVCSRYNLEITQVDYVYNFHPYRKLKWWPVLFVYGLLTTLRPEFCETHCYEIKKKLKN